MRLLFILIVFLKRRCFLSGFYSLQSTFVLFFLYAPSVMRYNGGKPPLMICTLMRDDIPSLSAWIKKFRSKERNFLVKTSGLEPPTPCLSCPPEGGKGLIFLDSDMYFNSFISFFARLLTRLLTESSSLKELLFLSLKFWINFFGMSRSNQQHSIDF